VALVLLYFYGGGGTIATPQTVGGHGSEPDDDPIRKGGIRWGSGQRQVTITGLVDPDEDDMRMLLYLISMLDD
jgi:hypothetical protein